MNFGDDCNHQDELLMPNPRKKSVLLALCVAATLAPSASAASETALAHFDAVAKVFLHPRCTNCHSAGDWPRQGDEQRRHSMNVHRGSAGEGIPGARCIACHAPRPLDNSIGLPPTGAHWRMPRADRQMVFEGKTPRELCLQLKDPEATGRPTLGEALEHVIHDDLVSWAFAPGADRSAPPLSKKDFFRRLARWARGGAPCPPP